MSVPPDMVPADKLAGRGRRQPPSEADAPDPQTVARRDRLVERFALMQCELGGLYYEMAIRGSVRDDVLRRRAAELQRVELELARVERILAGDVARAGDNCPSCGALAGAADVFCASCGRPLAPPPVNGNGNGHAH